MEDRQETDTILASASGQFQEIDERSVTITAHKGIQDSRLFPLPSAGPAPRWDVTCRFEPRAVTRSLKAWNSPPPFTYHTKTAGNVIKGTAIISATRNSQLIASHRFQPTSQHAQDAPPHRACTPRRTWRRCSASSTRAAKTALHR